MFETQRPIAANRFNNELLSYIDNTEDLPQSNLMSLDTNMVGHSKSQSLKMYFLHDDTIDNLDITKNVRIGPTRNIEEYQNNEFIDTNVPHSCDPGYQSTAPDTEVIL